MSFFKQLILFVFDIVILFISVFLWNWYYSIPDKFIKSALFTVYLGIIFLIYRFIFEYAWELNSK